MSGGTGASGSGGRIASLDQFRGYTVLGMIAVNLLSGFEALPAVFRHHNTYCSYADTIMPQFFFAVGFAYRLTFLRRAEREGYRGAIQHVFSRNPGLIVFGVVLYGLDGKYETWSEMRELGWAGVLSASWWRTPFQALVHIGVASLWVLPVIGLRARWRLAFMLGTAALHVFLSMRFYYGAACLSSNRVIDGGPLGFLTWSIPLLAGSLAYDVVVASRGRRALLTLAGGSVALMALGYALSCVGIRDWAAPPFVPPWHEPNLWAMNQRAGSVSYLTFSAGFSMAFYAFFVWACDAAGWGWGIFRTFGSNALAAYVLHMIVGRFIDPFAPNDAPGWYVAALGVFAVGLCWLFVRHLERNRIYIRM